MTKELFQAIMQALSNSLKKDVALKNTAQVYGGDINHTFVLDTTAGKFFLKSNESAAADMFEKEFHGLELLRKANVISVPNPIVHGKTGRLIFLVLEYIERGEPLPDLWLQFAHGLSALHKQSQAAFGLNENNYIGSLPQQNDTCNSWSEFYTIQRIMPLMRTAFEQKKCSKEDIAGCEKLCSRFNTLFPAEAPSLLHGDLWSGNFIIGKKGLPVIYDPAVYYGHREMDIAMTLLFGGFDKRFYRYYNEIFPLEKNWEQRTQLCQLYPLLVHLILFGGHYYYSVMDVIKKYK